MDTPESTVTAVEESSPKRFLKQSIGYSIAIACLIWVFHDVHWKDLVNDVVSIKWEWVIPAVFFDVASYYCQGVRWQLLLRPHGKLSSLKTTRAIYVGLFTNELLPLRVGEVVRLFLVSRWLQKPFAAMIPSLVVERFFDGIWLALAIALAAFFVPLPKDLLEAEELLAGFIVLLAILFVYLVFRRQRVIPSPNTAQKARWKPLQLAGQFINRLAGGVRDIGVSPYFFISLITSSGILIFQILSLWVMMLAYGIQLSPLQGAVVLLILHLGTAIPNAPSNAGTYQFFTVVGLALFGVDKTTAAGFSVAAFLILTIPLWLLGLISLWRTGMNFSSIRREVVKLNETV